VESPYAPRCKRAAPDEEPTSEERVELADNIAYARRALRDCLARGEAPIASHLLFTQDGVLDDRVPGERARGIAAGHAWIASADALVVYADRGVSRGMQQGIDEARRVGTPVEIRCLDAVNARIKVLP
jgi:hypothetical protein